MFERIEKILRACGTSEAVIPATELYNEGWMLRIILDWFAQNLEATQYPLFLGPGIRWFSEAWVPSPFLPTSRGDPLSESWTHADAVIGNFDIGSKGQCDLTLRPDTKHLVIVEAKIFSKLSSGVKNAKGYDQAARTTACIAETLRRARKLPASFSHLGFYVIAPAEQIKREPTFRKKTSKESIQSKVKARVDSYEGREDKQWKDSWFHMYFLPMLGLIDIKCLAWEDVIDFVKRHEPPYGNEISAFYRKCLHYNSSKGSVTK